MRTALASVSARMRGDFERYCRQEDGALAFFIILIFFLMMVFGGIAVDVMRFETRRVAMQQTMDRAVLAAASLNQSVDGQAVVDDYFAKADLGSGLGMVEFGTPTVTKSDPTDSSYRRVSINSTVRSYNFFMGMGFMPVEYLQSPVVSTAEQGVDKVEVILVLDVSGSMTNNGKLDALKVAAKNFVDTVKDADDKNQISIGIVPYQGQVNLGQALREQYTAAYLPPFGGVSDAGIPDVNCLEIPDSLFDASALSRTEPFPMAALADTRSAQGSQTPVDDEQQRICNPETDNTVLLPTKSKTELNAKIDSLTGSGYTSIMLGMRWGAALIDSDANAIYKALLPAEMHDRPAVKGSIPFTDKIIVLMTDGKHQSIPYVVDEYKEGTSPIYLVQKQRQSRPRRKGRMEPGDRRRPRHPAGPFTP
ncbi:MAG: pilus assembly protein [Tabrizicola sp.]|nr:pilus assembly protein [Tabrizicola sp.]